jgi:hypothetical protein
LIAIGQYRQCNITGSVFVISEYSGDDKWLIQWVESSDVSGIPYKSQHLLEDRLLSSLELELV